MIDGHFRHDNSLVLKTGVGLPQFPPIRIGINAVYKMSWQATSCHQTAATQGSPIRAYCYLKVI